MEVIKGIAKDSLSYSVFDISNEPSVTNLLGGQYSHDSNDWKQCFSRLNNEGVNLTIMVLVLLEIVIAFILFFITLWFLIRTHIGQYS